MPIIETALTRAYLESRTGTSESVLASLQQAERTLMQQVAQRYRQAIAPASKPAGSISTRSIATARRPCGSTRTLSRLPTTDVHPFASYRREAGLASGCLRSGDLHAATACPIGL